MIELFKIMAVLAAAVLMVSKKIDVSLVLIASSLLMGMLFVLSPYDMLLAVLDTLKSYRTINLIGIVVFMTLLGHLMKHLENLKRIILSLENVIDDTRIIVASIPAFIGLLPMPGGAMMSAPFVREAGGQLKLTPEQNTLINYWFRHIWEYSFPLYPAFVLMSTILDIPVRDISLLMLPFVILAIIFGSIFFLLPITKKSSGRKNASSNLRKLLVDVSPVLSVIILAIVFNVDLLLSLILTLILFILTSRIPYNTLRRSFSESKPVQLFLLIFSVMYFQTVITKTGSVGALPGIFATIGIPLSIIVFAVPFITGLLTGITFGTVGITFPIIAFALTGGGANMGYIMLAYLGAYLGVMASPVHLCIVLSSDYFGSDMRLVYRKLIPLIVIMSAFGAAFLLLGVV